MGFPRPEYWSGLPFPSSGESSWRNSWLSGKYPPANCSHEQSHFWEQLKYYSVQFSHSVMSNSLWPNESQHTRPPCPSPTPGVYSNPCPSSQWCHPAISSSVIPFSSCPQSLPASGSFTPLCMRWPKYWSFSINLSSEYSRLISFRMEWLDLVAVQGTLKSLSNTTVPKHQFFSAQLSL